MSNSVQANHKTIFEVFHSFCFGVMKINFIKFSQRAMGPTQGSLGAAGFDLYLVEEINVLPNLAHKIENDIGFEIPLGYFGKIHELSSFAKKFTRVGGGVIDSDYRGRVNAIFFNFSEKFLQITEGERFAQIVFHKISTPSLREVEDFEHQKRKGGVAAFGSTN